MVYVLVFTAAAWYKYDHYLMGFDLGVHEQVLWNTAHGRIAASSAFANTDSYFGIDIIPTELLLTPLYALLPSAYTMLLLQTLAVGLGAVPVFLLVRDRWETSWAGLVFAAALLLYLPVEYTNLYEFQVRAFATTFLLWALYALERRRFWSFMVWSLLALGCRSEAGLVVGGMGVATWLERAGSDKWVVTSDKISSGNPRHLSLITRHSHLAFTVFPILLGIGWLVICLQVLIPFFRGGAPSLYLHVIYGTIDGKAWLGDTVGAIIRTLITQPGFVLHEVFGGERGRERIAYLVEMFLPFGFLLVLQPRLLLITLPIFGLNLLSNTPNIHASIQKHYQALIVPFMVVGSAYGLHWLLRQLRANARWQRAALVGVLALGLVCNIGFRNPFFSLVGNELKGKIDYEKIAAKERLLAHVPLNASITATSSIGPHMARRVGIFFFPGNVIYPEQKVAQGEFLLIDSDEIDSGESTTQQRGQQMLAGLQANGQLPTGERYARIVEEHGVSLWRKVGSESRGQ